MMTIYSQDKKKILDPNYIDLDKGYLVDKFEIIHQEEKPYLEEVGHYELIKEYPNGGKEIRWKVDIEGQEYEQAWDERIEYQIYIPYSTTYIYNRSIKQKIEKEKAKLAATDYKVIKYIERLYTEEEFEEIKKERQQYRDNISELKTKLLPGEED